MKHRNLWLVLGVIFVLLVIVVSLIPDPPNPAEFKGSDKVGHFSAYTFMMLWFAQIYARNRIRWVIALALIMMGVVLECLQGLSGYRTFEYADMGANTAGVLFAMLLAQTPLAKVLIVVESSLFRFRK